MFGTTLFLISHIHRNINLGNLLLCNLLSVTQHIFPTIKNICGYVQYNSEYYGSSIATKRTGVAMTLYVRVREVVGSNLRWDTGYSD
jgi:hypothetical protein